MDPIDTTTLIDGIPIQSNPNYTVHDDSKESGDVMDHTLKVVNCTRGQCQVSTGDNSRKEILHL